MQKAKSPWNGQPKVLDLKATIVGIVSTGSYAFIATRDKTLYRYQTNQLTSPQQPSSVKTMNNFVNENVVRLHKVTSNGQVFIIVQCANHVFYLAAESATTNQVVQIPDVKNVKACTSIPSSSMFAIVDPKAIYIWTIAGNGTPRLLKQHPHTLKGVVDCVASANRILMWDRREYRVFDMELRQVADVKVSKPLRTAVSVDSMSAFLGVTGGQVVSIASPPLPHEISFSEDVCAFAVRVPYVYALAPGILHVSTTMAPLEDHVPLPSKAKNLVLEVLDDYSVLFGADSQLIVIPYSSHQIHCDRLTAEKNWEAAIELCRTLRSPRIQNDQDLSKLYEDYCDHLFAQRDYKKAFEMFRKSGRKPYKMIRKYGKLLQYEGFERLAENDAQEHKKLLQECKDLLENGAPASKVLDAMTKVRNQAGDKTKLPEASEILKCREVFLERCLSDISDINDVLDEIRQLFGRFGQQHGSSSNEAYVQLSEFIKEHLRNERQPTRIKIYNTILVECYADAGVMILGLEEFLKTRPALFFDVAAKALASDYEESFLQLCAQYRKHDAALNHLREQARKDGNYDRLINYIKHSEDCVELATKEFLGLFDVFTAKGSKMDSDTAAEKCVQVFFSKSLKLEDMERVISIIEKLDVKDVRSPITRDIMEIRVLEFAVNDLHIKRAVIHKKLIDLYLSVLRQKNGGLRQNAKYTRIEAETDPFVKKIRLGLLHLLDTSESYTASEVWQLIDNWLLEEKLAAMIRANMISKCLEECLKPKVDFQVALDFCDKVYRPGDVTRSGVYNELFTKLRQMKPPEVENPAAKIKRLLNERAERLDPDKVVENIPDMPLSELREYLSLSSLDRINRLRSLRIRNALLRMTIEAKRKELKYLQSGRVEVKENLKCVVCGKPIGESVFYVLSDNCVAHAACNPNRH